MKTTRKESPNSYIANRDNTSGRNNDNAGLTKLDKSYANHPNRDGVNATKHSFDHGNRVASKPLDYANDKGHDNQVQNNREDGSKLGEIDRKVNSGSQE